MNTVRAKQTYKNVVKNLVKENQRIHDYESKLGVKFWNKILKDSKRYGHNNKVFNENVKRIIEENYSYYNRILETAEGEEAEILKEKIFQLEFFIDGRWKNIIDEKARLYPEYREILYLVRNGEVE